MLIVLRLGHRKERDKRVSTHIGLVARALGADKVIYCGEQDPDLLKRVGGIGEKWGGEFKAAYSKDEIAQLLRLKRRGFTIVHLTMYGQRVQDSIEAIRKKYRKNPNMTIVVGAEKVPREIYELADWNIGVTNQPHSEVAALAIMLHELFQGKELETIYKDAKVRIIPSARVKTVVGSRNRDRKNGGRKARK